MKGLEMFWKIALGLVIGAVAGGALGYMGSCSTGTCPLTSDPYFGAFFGALIGLTIALGV